MKTNEAQAFAEFCDVSGILEYEDFTYQDVPDFVSLDRSLGIELVSYHRDYQVQAGSPMRQWEAQLNSLLADAKSRFLSSQTQRVDVVLFPRRDHGSYFPKGAPTDLLNFVASSLAGGSPALSPSLLEIAEDIRVAPRWLYSQSCRWQTVSANFTSVVVPSVQTILDDKETRIQSYREATKEVWLLVHGSAGVFVGDDEDRGRWSSCGLVTEELIRTKFSSSFDRVYYLDEERQGYVRLQLLGLPTTSMDKKIEEPGEPRVKVPAPSTAG